MWENLSQNKAGFWCYRETLGSLQSKKTKSVLQNRLYGEVGWKINRCEGEMGISYIFSLTTIAFVSSCPSLFLWWLDHCGPQSSNSMTLIIQWQFPLKSLSGSFQQNFPLESCPLALQTNFATFNFTVQSGLSFSKAVHEFKLFSCIL